MPTAIRAEALGASLGRAGIETVTVGDGALQHHLHACGLPGAADPVEFFTELGLFGMFPLDVIVARDVARHGAAVAERVRDAMRAQLLTGVNGMRAGARRPPLPRDAWEHRVAACYAAYAEALRRPGGDALRSLGCRAHARLTASAASARADVEATGHLAVWFGSAMRTMPGTIAGYRPV